MTFTSENVAIATTTPTDVETTALTSETPSPALFVNRELSWLEFNRRVLHEALDARTPLLERVGFLTIFTSNLDEFFMKRVGGLKRQLATGVVSQSLDGKTAGQQLAAIRAAVLPMLADQARVYREEIRPALRTHGVHLLDWQELTEDERKFADEYFRRDLFPVLTPLAVDPGHPFPFISNLSESLGIVLRHPEEGERLFARVKIPANLPSWIRLGGPTDGSYRYARLQDIMIDNLPALFPDMEVLGVMPFRVTRNGDVERDEEDAEDLLEMMEEELRARRFASVVRLEHGPNPDAWLLRFLLDELALGEQDVYELTDELDYTSLRPLLELPLPQLKAEPWVPVVPGPLADNEVDIFSVIRSGDLLVHHPYESFTASVERFLSAAAADDKVLAIKMTLYRTGDDSPFIGTLVRAAEAGKQVVCLVEVKARFDEQRNIQVAQMLEKAGVHVVYGIVGLKTHAKIALAVRREPEGLRCYAHIGTGNYNSGTARLYTDFGLFTAKPDFTEDVVELFHYLTGRSMKRDYRRLIVAPVNMKKHFLEMIDREAEHASQGRPAGIVAKMNSLEDPQVIQALYRASRAGVPIDLIVRGFCCLRPGVPGLSENIRVMSVVGRFLEHSRVFWFRNGAEDPIDGELYIGSADWMYRNLQNRVEAVTPIEERSLRERLWQTLQVMLGDQRQAWDMDGDGNYVQRSPADAAVELGTHRRLMSLAQQRWRVTT
ncbi:MAG TPA: polyphosphate kinase 1 [Candidatus Binatia bacterium]|nr:polyphosphate kinase 1 [Candidatus Binatia bacterium]